MIRLTCKLAVTLAVFAAGPAMSAGDEEPSEAEALEAARMGPHAVTLPASYVAFPDDFVFKIRNKILVSRGEEPMEAPASDADEAK